MLSVLVFSIKICLQFIFIDINYNWCYTNCKKLSKVIYLKITALVENTTQNPTIETEHGLSLYIETDNHKILFDMGQTDMFARNAERLNIDISSVDIAVLSHGHYDHGGGIKKFLQLNNKAPVYISNHAFEPHYSGTEKYIGLDTTLINNNRLIAVSDYFKVDSNLEIFSCNKKTKKHSTNSYGLNMVLNNTMIPDDFSHEQYLLIKENDKKILISGCSHKGILNIMDWFNPDILIGGFHFMKLEPLGNGEAELKKSAEILKSFNTTYYTCHCTGVEQFNYIKNSLDYQLKYLACGESIII